MMKCVTIKSSGAHRLRAGGLWVYANEINERLPDFESGEIVSVRAPGGDGMGLGYIEPRSLIALRLLRRTEGPIDRAFLHGRIGSANAERRRFVRDSSYRVVFSEADRLPGLIIDRYGDLLTLQCNTWGIERLKREIIEVLQEIFHPVAIIVRNGGEFRREMGLPTEDERLIFGKKVDVTNYEVNLVGLSLGVDFTTAQKTGLYLDQVHSYRTVAGMDFSGLTGMDLFCYSGIFGMLSLKHGADRVTFVDSSGAALSRLAENLRRNGISKERYDIVRSDVPSYLSDCVPESRGFLFLDPPKFIQSRKSYYKGLQGYFNLNRAAVRSLRDGGFLFTFSCSHHAGEEVFRRKVVDAMQKEACTAREYYHFRQNADHAVLLPMEESFYLKGFLFGIDRRKEETNDAMGVS